MIRRPTTKLSGAPRGRLPSRKAEPARPLERLVGAQGSTPPHHPTQASAGNATNSDFTLNAHGTRCTNLSADLHDGTPDTGSPQRHVTRETRQQKMGGQLTHRTSCDKKQSVYAWHRCQKQNDRRNQSVRLRNRDVMNVHDRHWAPRSTTASGAATKPPEVTDARPALAPPLTGADRKHRTVNTMSPNDQGNRRAAQTLAK